MLENIWIPTPGVLFADFGAKARKCSNRSSWREFCRPLESRQEHAESTSCMPVRRLLGPGGQMAFRVLLVAFRFDLNVAGCWWPDGSLRMFLEVCFKPFWALVARLLSECFWKFIFEHFWLLVIVWTEAPGLIFGVDACVI